MYNELIFADELIYIELYCFATGIPLEFIRQLPELVITEVPKEPVTLECELSRRPKDNVKWLKDGKALPSRLPTRMRIEDGKSSTIHRIVFTSLTEEDLGQYTAQVEKLSTTGKIEMKGELTFCAVSYICHE